MIKNKNSGFTLIEILVVATIIVLLTSIASVVYTQFTKQSRDARRKLDLGQIASALEMYRSNNSTYPTSLNTLTSGTVYINSIPTDPLASQGYVYQYTALPGGCTTNCYDYVVGAYLENSSTCSSPPGGACKGAGACNYCLGPYGQK